MIHIPEIDQREIQNLLENWPLHSSRSAKLAHEHYLDRWLGLYELDSYKRWLFRKVVIDILREYVKGRKMVLEIGCSKGYLLGEMEKVGYTPVGVDISFTALTYGNNSGAAVVRSDGENLPLESDSFESIIAIHSLEHLPSPFAAIQEAYRVLHDRGLFLAITPNKSSWLAKISARGMKYTSLKNPYHVGLMDCETLSGHVQSAGFRSYRVLPFHNGFFGLPKIRKYIKKTFIPLSWKVPIPQAHHQIVIALK